jgi:hypothetical protein
MKRLLAIFVMSVISSTLIACGDAPPATATAGNSTASAEPKDNQAELVRAYAANAKKLGGQCATDEECNALVTDQDLIAAKRDMTTVLGTSAMGAVSSRAPSTYFANLQAWSCTKGHDACAQEWFATFQTDIRRAVKEGDDSDDVLLIPKDRNEINATMPFTQDDLRAANVNWQAVDNVWMCRSAIMYRRWRASGDKDTTKAQLNEALRTCFKG